MREVLHSRMGTLTSLLFTLTIRHLILIPVPCKSQNAHCANRKLIVFCKGNRHRRRHQHQARQQNLDRPQRRAERAPQANRHVRHGLPVANLPPETRRTSTLLLLYSSLPHLPIPSPSSPPIVLIAHTQSHKPSACTPLFLSAFARGAGCCIHTHSIHAVLVTLLVERDAGPSAAFEIECIEQIKGVPRGRGKEGNLGYFDRLRIPIIENTAREEDLKGSLEEAMEAWPDTCAVLVRRHGM